MLLLRCLLLLLWTGLAQAEACGSLRLAFYDYPGLYQRDAAGQEGGFDVELVRLMAERSGCRFEARPYSAKRTWAAMAAGELDVVVSARRTPERAPLYDFLVVARTKALVLMRRAEGQRLRSAADFLADPRARLIVVAGTSYGPQLEAWLRELRQRGRLSEAGDQNAALRAFEVGRGQGLLIYPMALLGREPVWLQRHLLQDWWPQEPALGGWALSRRTLKPDQRQLLRESMAALARDGSLQRLMSRHLGPTLTPHFSGGE